MMKKNIRIVYCTENNYEIIFEIKAEQCIFSKNQIELYAFEKWIWLTLCVFFLNFSSPFHPIYLHRDSEIRLEL